MPHLIDKAEALLRQRGFKITSQRTLVLQILAGQASHLDAEEIYALAYQQDTSVSLATIYRTLNLFTELELVDHRYVERDHRREVFRLLQGPEQHYLTCVRCDARVLINTDLLDQMTRDIIQHKGVSVTGTCACFIGYCAPCAAALRRTGEL